MGIRQFFKDKVKEINSKKYEPKFKVGDIILNKKYKIARKIVKICSLDTNVKGDLTQYEMIDIHNPLSNVKNYKYSKYKYCVAIDNYYDKVDERTVKILFGVNNE